MSFTTLLPFIGISLLMVLSPGPNMIYIVSRTISQGRKAGFFSLFGISTGSFFYMLCSAFGVSVIFHTIPILYSLLSVTGACYLFYLAWKMLIPSGGSPFRMKKLSYITPRKLFQMGFLTSILNPKVMLVYLSIVPQFIHPENGLVLVQFLILGMIQVLVSLMVNSLIIIGAESISSGLTSNKYVELCQRWLFACILIAFSIHLLIHHHLK